MRKAGSAGQQRRSESNGIVPIMLRAGISRVRRFEELAIATARVARLYSWISSGAGDNRVGCEGTQQQQQHLWNSATLCKLAQAAHAMPAQHITGYIQPSSLRGPAAPTNAWSKHFGQRPSPRHTPAHSQLPLSPCNHLASPTSMHVARHASSRCAASSSSFSTAAWEVAEGGPLWASILAPDAPYTALWLRLQQSGSGPGSVEAEVVATFRHLSEEDLADLTGVQLSNVMWALACLGHHDQDLFLRLVEALYGKLNDLSCQHLANTLWAMAVSGSYNSEVFAALTEFIWEVLPQASPRQLAVMCAAYATFSHYDDDQDLFDAIANNFCRQLEQSTLSDMALLVKSMAVLQLNPGAVSASRPGTSSSSSDQTATATAGSSSDGASNESTTTPSTRGLFSEVCTELVRRLDTSIASAGSSCSESLESAAPLERPSTSDLADVLWACAWIGHHNRSLMDVAARQLLEAASLHGVKLETDTRSRVLGFGAKLGRRHALEGPLNFLMGLLGAGPEHGALGAMTALEALQDKRQQRHHGHAPQHAGSSSSSSQSAGSSSFYAASAGPPVPATSRNCVLAGGLLDAWSASHNPALPAGWCGTERDDDKALGGRQQAKGCSSSTPRADSIVHPENLTKVLWSYAILRHWHPSLLPLLIQQLHSLPPDELTAEQAGRIGAASVALVEVVCRSHRIPITKAMSMAAWNHVSRELSSSLRVPELLMPQAFVEMQRMEMHEDDLLKYKSWKYRPPDALTRAAMHKSVAYVLATLGHKVLASACTLDGCLVPHIGIKIRDFYLAVDLLDASCCIRTEPHIPIGPVISRHLSFAFRGWAVLPIPFHEWVALSDDLHAKRRYLMDKLQAVETAVHQQHRHKRR